MTQWTVTHDYLDDKPASVVGPHNATMTSEQIATHPDRVAFRMYDDDGELYYRGFLVGDDLHAPLDDYGMPNAGCTSIKVLEKGKWEQV